NAHEGHEAYEGNARAIGATYVPRRNWPRSIRMTWTITGTTRLYAIIADPVAQVKTPEVLNDYFRRNELDAVLVPMHVGADGLEDAFAAFRRMKNLGGVIVTVPHKTTSAALCDELRTAGE